MSFAYPLTGLVTVLTLIVYFWMALNVGKVRTKLNVPAPATSGPDEFMRTLRVHENTMEGLLLFLPALWLFALSSHDLWAAIIGVFYPLGRLLYARGYYEAANKRSLGFTIGIIATGLLILGAAIEMIMSLVNSGM
ncbi:MAG: MAPEG family protein [Parvibaculum sp.]|uniref:MAPEG family protein n=1 Tax=Parvibaculum sp. TaxID=2024848 RepID=UPI0025F48E8D|nr:MAPEG family protein [Parvibaculum sp.]MCE9649835.1 MAPEG family protein [Parvibaculum sp.]